MIYLSYKAQIRKSPYVILVTLLLSICGCNPRDSGKSTNEDDTSSVRPATGSKTGGGEEEALATSSSLHVLYLTKSQFEELKNRRVGASQIALLTFITNETPSRFNLLAWPAKWNDKFRKRTYAVPLTISPVINTTIAGEMIISTQKLRPTIVSAISRELEAPGKDIVAFYPVLSEGILVYGVKIHSRPEDITVDLGILQFLFRTNPAPPGIFDNTSNDPNIDLD